MYTSQKSIENKVGSVEGWMDLLMSVGFRFEPAANGIPSAVFFPQSDPGERLAQCSASLQAILALSQTSWAALSNLLVSPDSADEIMALFRQVIGEFGPRDLEAESVQIPVNVKLWRIPGCHELLASLGFDLMEVGRDEITLRTCRNANKRQIQFALQTLVALFDTDEAPRSVNVDSNDSMDDCNDDEDTSRASDSPVPPPVPPFPLPRKSDLVLDGTGGAFSSYARNRGEPDGRQAQGDSPTGSTSSGYQGISNPVLPSILHSNIYHQKGRESDCNFTPSPVENLRGISRYPGNYSLNSSHENSSHLSSTYSPSKLSLQGSKFKHGPSPLSRPESCSSTSSINDWEAIHSTVLRRQSNFSKLSPGVTDSANMAGIGLVSRKYLMSNQAGAYENFEQAKLEKNVAPVRSVFTESGYNMLGKAKLIETSNVNDKLSIRAEINRVHPSLRKDTARLEPGVTTRVPPTGESNSPQGSINKKSSTGEISQFQSNSTPAEGVMVRKETLGEPGIKEQIMSTQMRRINRELPISEVYHERNIGLGLAPPLSKLIMSNNIAVAQIDHHPEPELCTTKNPSDNINSFDNLSVIEEAHPLRKARPSVPPKPDHWNQTGYIKPDPTIMSIPPTRVRDEGDGRSMTDSQYSGYSPNSTTASKDLTSKFNYLRVRDPVGGFRQIPGSQVTTVINPNIRPSDVAQYINSEFHSNKEEKMRESASKHPHLWSKDKNGRFTYTGNLSSDC